MLGKLNTETFKYICLTTHSLHSKWTILKANKRRESQEVGGETGETGETGESVYISNLENNSLQPETSPSV